MDGNLEFSVLKEKQRALRADFRETMALRMHRAISRVGRSEACDGDDDARFLFLWIAFNAAYADEREFQLIAPSERAAFLDFFGKLVALANEIRIHRAVWQRFTGPVRMLMENRFVFNSFWQYHNGIDGIEDWEERLKASIKSFAQAFRAGDSARVLSFVLIGCMSYAINLFTVARPGIAEIIARKSETGRPSWHSCCPFLSI